MAVGNMGLSQVAVDVANIGGGASVAAYLVDSLGQLLTSTLVSGMQALDVNVAQSALPAGAATSSLQSAGNSSLSSIDGKITNTTGGAIKVDGSAFTQPISAASLPLPTGASTSALQTSGNASLSSIDAKLVDGFGAASAGLRTASQIGNATGAADFGAGTTSAQTLRVVLPTDQSAIPVSQSGTWSITVNEGAQVSNLQQSITVGTSAVALPTLPLVARKALFIQNQGDKPLYVGSATVTAAPGATQGLLVGKGGFIEVDVGPSNLIYAVCGSSGGQVNIWELS